MSFRNVKIVEVLIRFLDYAFFVFGAFIGIQIFQSLGNWKYLIGLLIGIACRKIYLFFALAIVKKAKSKEPKVNSECN